ncbi:MAG: hypothetical protein H6Q97_1023, partial [Nitrospirae bacterium]|nr:hypothetical protein [Nitrospirota bacterium]
MVRRLEHDLSDLKDRVLRMGSLV